MEINYLTEEDRRNDIRDYEIKTSAEDNPLERTTELFEAAIAELIENPTIGNARRAHTRSMRAKEALEKIQQDHSRCPIENVEFYQSLNRICIMALERVPINNGDREHAKYWASLIIRRNELVRNLMEPTYNSDEETNQNYFSTRLKILTDLFN